MVCWKNTSDPAACRAVLMPLSCRLRTFLVLSCLLTNASCVTPAPPLPRQHDLAPAPKPAVDAAEIEKKVHALINRERKSHGLPALELDPALSRIARAHSRDMADRQYFGHVSPEGDDFSDRYRKAHYLCSVPVGSTEYLGGENIALNNLYSSVMIVNGVAHYDWNSEEKISRTTVRGWMDSTGHRKNILTPYFRKQGIGVHIAPDDRVYITQTFC